MCFVVAAAASLLLGHYPHCCLHIQRFYHDFKGLHVQLPRQSNSAECCWMQV